MKTKTFTDFDLLVRDIQKDKTVVSFNNDVMHTINGQHYPILRLRNDNTQWEILFSDAIKSIRKLNPKLQEKYWPGLNISSREKFLNFINNKGST